MIMLCYTLLLRRMVYYMHVCRHACIRKNCLIVFVCLYVCLYVITVAKYLPDACSGVSIGGMCMSEPGHGTDVMGMTTTASLNATGTHYTLNGTKMWITNGTLDGTSVGDLFLLYAKTSHGRDSGSLTSFLIEKSMPGYTLGQKITDTCGMRASMTAELVLSDVQVSESDGAL